MNGSEAFVASEPMLDQSRRAAAAAAASGSNGQQQQQQTNLQPAAAALGQQPPQQNGPANQQGQSSQTQLQHGIPIVDVEVQELPQLIWTVSLDHQVALLNV